MHEWLQLAITGLIVGLVLVVWYRHGQANPEPTGKLSRQIGKLFAQITTIEKRLDGLATKTELQALGGELKQIEKAAASSGELSELREKIGRVEERLTERVKGQGDTLQSEIRAVAGSVSRVERVVQTIEGILLNKGLDR